MISVSSIITTYTLHFVQLTQQNEAVLLAISKYFAFVLKSNPGIYTVSQKKTSHFNFRHNFTICGDIFTIFEAPCSGLIAGWCNVLHTHRRCEAFTWRDITRRHSSCCAPCAVTLQISYHLTYGVCSSDLNPAEYSFWSIMREKVYQTHIANIDMSWNIG